MAQNMDILRTKSCIVDKFNLHALKPKKQSYITNMGHARSYRNLNEISDGVNNKDSQNKDLHQTKSFDLGTNEFENSSNLIESKILNEENDKSPERQKQNRSRSTSKRETSMSETKIKSMVHMLKNSSKFGPNQDLALFLNNKLNDSYISMKTAFEYIDPDHLGHLLVDEFKIVLEEFSIFIESNSYNNYLKK